MTVDILSDEAEFVNDEEMGAFFSFAAKAFAGFLTFSEFSFPESGSIMGKEFGQLFDVVAQAA